MVVTCMCGDTACPSCGAAQGTLGADAEPNEPECCENCGMEAKLFNGFCEGCTCNCCGAGGSMDAGGQCQPYLTSYQACRLIGSVRTWARKECGATEAEKVLGQLANLDDWILKRFQ